MSVVSEILKIADGTRHRYDFVRVTIFAALIWGLGLETYTRVWQKVVQPFSLSEFGQGIGFILAAGGLAAWGQSKESKEKAA